MARIIYVEDDALVGQAVQELLSRAGHLVGVIPHGTLGFDSIAFKQPDLVILDQGLPVMSGNELLKGLRGIAGLYRTPIIMLTANRKDATIREAMDYGASDYLLKHFEPEELVRRVDELLLRSAAARDS